MFAVSIVLKSSKSKPVSQFVDGRDELGVGSFCVWNLVLLVLVVLHVVDHEPRKVIDTDDGQSHFHADPRQPCLNFCRTDINDRVYLVDSFNSFALFFFLIWT